MKKLLSIIVIAVASLCIFLSCAAKGDELVYEAQYLGFDAQYRQLTALDVQEDSIFLLAQQMTAYGEDLSTIVELDGNGKKIGSFSYISQQFGPIEAGWQGQSMVESIAVDSAKNMWLLEQQYSAQNPGESADVVLEPRVKYALTKIDSKGNVLLSLDINEFFEGKDSLMVRKQIICDNEDNVYLLLKEGFYGDLKVFSDKGELLYEPDTMISTIAATENGELVVSAEPSESDARPVLCLLDVKNKSVGTKLETEVDFSYLYGGSGSTVYFNNLTSIYSYDLTAQETVKIFDWMDSDLTNGAVQYFDVLPDGSFMLLGTGIYSTEQDVLILRPVPASSVQEKTLLTVATGRATYELKAASVQFNRTNPDYKIKIAEYVDPNRPDISDLDKLYIDIASGNIPDMMDLDYFNTEQIIRAGIMEDLYPYLDTDPDLSKEDFLPNLLKTIEVDGSLYYLPVNIILYVVAGDADVVGEKSSWTMDALYKTIENNPQYKYIIGEGCGQTEFLKLAMQFNLGKFVDSLAYTCDFENEEFYELLRFTKEHFPAQGDELFYTKLSTQFEAIMLGEQMLYYGFVPDENMMQFINSLFGKNTSFIGFPAESGGSNLVDRHLSMGITSSSKHKDVAWNFIREFYLEKSYNDEISSGFPSNIHALDKQLERAMETRFETGPDGEAIEAPKNSVTQMKAEEIREILFDVDLVISRDRKIENIVIEEAGAFFAGDRTAEETAALINSRVKLLLSERE